MNYISRRHFIKSAGTAGFALWLGLSAKGEILKVSASVESKNFSPFIKIEPNGQITLFNIKPEMGQGTYQSIPALIAEEFEVSLDQVIIKIPVAKKSLAMASVPEEAHLFAAVIRRCEKLARQQKRFS